MGVTRVPDDFVLPPRESLIEAQRLLDAGLPFHAHEVLEGTWKASPPAERELWRGLAQLAVGLTHLLRGNVVGGVALLRRASLRIADYAAAPPHDVDVEGLRAWVDEVLAKIAAGQAASAATAGSPDPKGGAGVTRLELDAGSISAPRLLGG